MRIFQTEYLLKGVYLGLVLFAGLVVGALGPDQARDVILRVNGGTLAGLAAALLVAALFRLRLGFRIKGRLLAFILFLLLESPILAYLGILGGTVGGLYLASAPVNAYRDKLAEPTISLLESLEKLPKENATEAELAESKRLQAALEPLMKPVRSIDSLQGLFLPVVGVGAIAGLVFGYLRRLENRYLRIALILGLAGLLAVLAIAIFGLDKNVTISGLQQVKGYALINSNAFAAQLLLGIPFFYALTYSGHEEESEIEMGIICGILGLGLFIYLGQTGSGSMAILLPLVVYFGYTLYVLPGLRVTKHAFRGLGHARAGKFRKAMQSFRRALQLDPNNRLAREGFWEVHRSLDVKELMQDPQALALLDLDLCLSRAGTLLLNKPDPEQRDEALRLLDLVFHLQPDRKPQIEYWHAVAYVHVGNVEKAAELLEGLLDPAHYGHENPHRFAVLLPAWQLCLMWHPELRKRVGEPQIAHLGRRMEAIAALERYAAENPEDTSIAAFKELLYRDVTEAEYNAHAGEGMVARLFDHAYAQQLGLAIINDDAHWQRGGEFLRLAARGLPTLGPTLFVQIAQAQQRAGHLEEARHNYELAKRAGQSVGPKNLAEAERQAYFATVKHLGEEAMGRDDLDGAIENVRLYSESERSGIETLRMLAELYERKGDPLYAARVTDQALQYNAKDPDLLARKERYYYSIMPSDLKARLEQFGHGFDVDYCLRRSRSILAQYSEPEWLDVAHHLAQLALVMKPESLAAKVLLARILLRLGERERAVAMLEEVRGPQLPERFASGEDETAWFEATQLLGDLYLERDRPDLAVPCLNDFRRSSKSGARTWYKLGQAYEALGNPGQAKKCYEQVAAYEGNPLAPEAQDALMRLQGHA